MMTETAVVIPVKIKVAGAIVNSCRQSLRGFFAIHMHCLHIAFMGVPITIRDVPKTVRDELAARAAQEGKSMQEYWQQVIETLASRPSLEQWVAAVRDRKSLPDNRVSAKDDTQAREQDRR